MSRICGRSIDAMMNEKPDRGYRFIDMHCHIIPGVDDGSKDMEMSLGMARAAVENNIHEIIVTPHWTGDRRSASPDGIRRRAEELQRVCGDEGIDLVFYPGNELLYDHSLPKRLRSGEVLTLAESRYCLVEFFPMDDFSYIRDGLRAIQYEGFTPVLAHCERYVCLVKRPEYAEELASQQILLQCNAACVEQKLFQPQPKFVNGLLRRDLVSFVASDAHRSEGDRRPNLAGAAGWMRKKYGEDAVRRILFDNPQRIIQAGKI